MLHRVAGGTGTYADPITVAVGHSLATGADVLDLPPGTRLYAPSLRRYGVVEDTCGDGPTPQYGPCHALAQARAESGQPVMVWLDWYMAGQGASAGGAAACASRLTRADPVLINPAPGLAVIPGPLIDAAGACRF